MKVLGLVLWTDRDKRGNPFAGVRPLVELQKDEWRPINAAEEFPSQGQVFWPNAQAAVEDSFIIFRAESNAGQKDEFKVVGPRPQCEVLDLRRHGTAAEVRAALVAGVRVPGPFGTVRALIWCKPDVLIGPVELNRVATGTARLAGTNLHRLPMHGGAQVRTVVVDRRERLLRADEAGPSGYVDWDDDAVVLRRALEAAVRVARQAGRDAGQTTKQIEDAARALAAQGVGPDAQLDRYRLERALALLENTDAVARGATDLAAALREHPAIKNSLDALTAKVRADVEQSARAELEHGLALERAALKETADARARANSELESKEQELRKVEEQLAAARSQVASAAKEAESAVDARVLAAIDRPMDLLAEVSVLRPFLGQRASRAEGAPPRAPSSALNWSRLRGDEVKDRASLRRVLTSSARARGVDPALMLQVHAAIVARLMPITLGPSALAALTAFAHAACGGRLLIIHVSPSAIQPHDFDELPAGGLLAASSAAKDVDGLSLVVLEGANRAPLEACVVPLLQLTEVGMSPLSSPGGLRLAASVVAGATTVPVTSQVWSHAAAIYPDPSSTSAAIGAPGDVVLSSDLLVPGDEPTGLIEALLDAWPDCRELRPAMGRLGSALARLYDDEPRISDALLHGLVLPYVATALAIEEQAEAVGKAGDTDGVVLQALRRFRRRLA